MDIHPFKRLRLFKAGPGPLQKKKKTPPLGEKGDRRYGPARLQKEGRRNSSDSQPVSCHHVCPVPHHEV